MSKYGYFVILERPDWSIAVSLRRPGRELRQAEATLRPPHVLRPMKDRQEHWQVSEPPTKTSHDHFHQPCQTSSRPRLSRQVSRQRLNISAEAPDSAIILPPWPASIVSLGVSQNIGTPPTDQTLETLFQTTQSQAINIGSILALVYGGGLDRAGGMEFCIRA